MTATPTATPPAAPADAPATGTAGGPLRGVVVLDLATVGPAARCTRILADYGATVVKVGAVPGRGAEPIRPPFYAYSGSRYLQRTAIDLKDPDGRRAFLALVRTADVVVESFRPGVIDRLGIGMDDLAAVNPSIIVCSTTGYGQDGPRAAWAGPRHQLPGRRRLSGHHRAQGRRGTPGARGHHRRRRRRWDARGAGRHGRAGGPWRVGPDRGRSTSTCPSPRACCG